MKSCILSYIRLCILHQFGATIVSSYTHVNLIWMWPLLPLLVHHIVYLAVGILPGCLRTSFTSRCLIYDLSNRFVVVILHQLLTWPGVLQLKFWKVSWITNCLSSILNTLYMNVVRINQNKPFNIALHWRVGLIPWISGKERLSLYRRLVWGLTPLWHHLRYGGSAESHQC